MHRSTSRTDQTLRIAIGMLCGLVFANILVGLAPYMLSPTLSLSRADSVLLAVLLGTIIWFACLMSVFIFFSKTMWSIVTLLGFGLYVVLFFLLL